jgi:uncharacterized protein
VIAVDTNILVAFQRKEYPWHDKAFETIRALAEEYPLWAIPWPCIHEWIAIVTHPRIFKAPNTLDETLAAISVLMESPSLKMIGEGPQYMRHFEGVLKAGTISGPKVHDARIAAICLENGVRELWTLDRDFSRFPSLKTRNPLAS